MTINSSFKFNTWLRVIYFPNQITTNTISLTMNIDWCWRNPNWKLNWFRSWFSICLHLLSSLKYNYQFHLEFFIFQAWLILLIFHQFSVESSLLGLIFFPAITLRVVQIKTFPNTLSFTRNKNTCTNAFKYVIYTKLKPK